MRPSGSATYGWNHRHQQTSILKIQSKTEPKTKPTDSPKLHADGSALLQ